MANGSWRSSRSSRAARAQCDEYGQQEKQPDAWQHEHLDLDAAQ